MTYEVTLERAEAALMYLAESDTTYARAVTELHSCRIRSKRVRARIFHESQGTVAERQAAAEIHPDTCTADDDEAAALLRKETLSAARERAGLVIDFYRTLEASRRKGA